MTKFRDIDSHIPTRKFRTAKNDLDVAGDIKCETLTATGNVILGDDSEIKFGNSTDLSIRHDPDLNKISFSKQLQFNSSCSSGDTFKITESALRGSKLLFASQNAAGALKSNYVMSVGMDDTGATNRRIISESIQRQDSGGSHVFRQITQAGTTLDNVSINHLAKTTFSNDVNIVDNKSLFLGDSSDLQLAHDSGHSYIDEQGAGDLRIRTNGAAVTLHSTTSGVTGNFMGRFVSGGAAELYHNNALKLTTTVGGARIGDAFSHDNTEITFTESSTQFALAGTHNTGQPAGTPNCKLLITGYDNDQNTSITYPIAVVDENGAIDFSVRASYEGGNVPKSKVNVREYLRVGNVDTQSSGLNAAVALEIHYGIVQDIVETVIKVDLQGLYSANSGKSIGNNGGSNVWFMLIDNDKHGTVFRATMACIETPTGGIADINLTLADNQTDHNVAPTGNPAILLSGGTHSIGRYVETASGAAIGDTNDKYLYLTTHSGTNTSIYSAGKFIIRLYGSNSLFW